MTKPLWTEAEAQARALALLAQFDREPDVLSPDEQALCMAVRTARMSRNKFTADIAETIGGMAQMQYAKDIRGQLALAHWDAIMKMLRGFIKENADGPPSGDSDN